MILPTYILLLILLPLTTPLSTKDNEIFDLQEPSSTEFLQEASDWQVTNPLTSTKTTICAGNPLLAGYQTLQASASIQRTYTISQPHTSVFLSFDAYMMGTWTLSDNVLVTIKSSTSTFSQQQFLDLSQNVAYTGGGKCVSTIAASTFSKKTTYISSAHSGSTLILLLESTTSSSGVTFGIRNVRIMVSNTPVTTPTQCFESNLATVLNACKCTAGQRKSGSTCVDCDVSCETCFGGTSSGCYSCSSNYYYDGENCQKCSTGCATCNGGAATDCLTCDANYFMYPSGACKSSCNSPYTSGTVDSIEHCYLPCGTTGKYYYEDGNCRTDCDLPFTSSTDVNGAKFCHNPCTSGKNYFPDGICRLTCALPFTSTTTYGAKFCNYPCGSTGKYYYNDGTCRSTCDLPFKAVTDLTGAKFCNNPCSSSQHYFPDGICRLVCALPFTSTTTYGGAKFCNYPCGTTGNYFYNDGVCRSSCDTPFTSSTDSTGAKFCNNPCSSGQYYFPDSICRSTCDLPFTSMMTNGAKFCHSPCGTTGDYYYRGDEICRSACNSPFTSSTDNGVKFCNYPCETNEYRYVNGTCSTSQCPSHFEVKEYFNYAEYKYCECASPYVLMMDGSCSEQISETEKMITKLGSVGNTTGVINSVGLAIAAVAMPGDPGGVSTGALTKVIQYSKFLNISYPDKLVMMFKAYNPASGIVSFVPKMSQEQKRKLTDEHIPENFAVYGVHSCFVVNFWSFMLFLLVLCIVCVGFMMLERLFKELGIWVRKVRAILQNFWIVQLYNSSGDIILFSIIQFKNNSWDSSEDTLNFLMAIFFLLLVIVMLATHMRTLMQYQKVRKEPTETVKKFEKTYECQQIFFGSFVSTTMNQQLFLFFFVVRIMILNLIIATLFKYPVMQTILMMILNLLLILYILIRRPFISKIDLAQHLSYELILLTVNGCLLSFSVMDEGKAGTRENMAELIIICSLIFTFLPILFLTLKVIVLVIQFYKEYRSKKQKRKGSDGQNFEQKVEDLRAQRRMERQHNPNHLLNVHQGLNIKPPREMPRSNHHSMMQSPKDCVQLDCSKNNSSTMEHSNFYQQDRKNRLMRNNNRNNPGQFSPAQNLDLSTMSQYPLNSNKNNSTINYNQNTTLYMDSTLDITLQETQYQQDHTERFVEFSPHQNMQRNARRMGREIDKLHQQRPRIDSFDKHPFGKEIRKYSNDEMLMESIKTTSKRVTERIRRRKKSHNDRKASEMSGDDEFQY